MRLLAQISVLSTIFLFLLLVATTAAIYPSDDIQSPSHDATSTQQQLAARVGAVGELLQARAEIGTAYDLTITTNNCSLSMDGSMLRGRCKIPYGQDKGKWAASVIDINLCFENQNGKVVYTGGKGGGFWDTCKDCLLLENRILQCFCYTGPSGPPDRPDEKDFWTEAGVDLGGNHLEVNIESGYLCCGLVGGYIVSDTPTLVQTDGIGHGPVTVQIGGNSEHSHSSHRTITTKPPTKKPSSHTTAHTTTHATAHTTTHATTYHSTHTTAAAPPKTTAAAKTTKAKTTPGYFITNMVVRDFFW